MDTNWKIGSDSRSIIQGGSYIAENVPPQIAKRLVALPKLVMACRELVRYAEIQADTNGIKHWNSKVIESLRPILEGMGVYEGS